MQLHNDDDGTTCCLHVGSDHEINEVHETPMNGQSRTDTCSMMNILSRHMQYLTGSGSHA